MGTHGNVLFETLWSQGISPPALVRDFSTASGLEVCWPVPHEDTKKREENQGFVCLLGKNAAAH